MSYRNPRFCYYHATREMGSAGFDTGNSTTPIASTPISTLWDNRAHPNVKWTLQDVGIPFIRRGVLAGDTRAVNRVIIPKGHNLHEGALIKLFWDPEGDSLPSASLPLLDVMPASPNVLSPIDGIIDVEFQDLNTQAGFRVSLFTSFLTTGFELGEIWLTRTEQATRGIVQSWEEVSVPNVRQSISETGHTFWVEQGEPLRTFHVEHRHLKANDPDLVMYDELFRYTRGVNPFWFEHADSGDAKQVVQLTNSSTHYIASGSGAPTFAALAVGNIIFLTSTAVGVCDLVLDFDDFLPGVPVDLRDYIIEYDWYVTSTAFMLSQNSHQFYVNPAGSPNVYSCYNIAHFEQLTALTWNRTQIDLAHPNVVSPGAVGASLSHPNSTGLNNKLRWRWTSNVIGQQFHLSNVKLIKKSKQPVLVQIVPGSIRRVQDSLAPVATNPSFTISFDMIEVSS